MIEISNEKAGKIQELLQYFSALTAAMPRSNKLDNARRVAINIKKYLNNKTTNNYGKRNKKDNRTTE